MSDIQENQEKMYLIESNQGVHFEFKIFLEEDKIRFWIKEDKIFAPYTFEESFTYDQFVEHHKIFKACDNLNEIYDHFIQLYKSKKIALMDCGANDERILDVKVDFIAKANDDVKDFSIIMKMTENKEEDLMKLYNIQKDQIAALREIKQLLKKEQLSKEVPFYKAIMEEIDKCESKVDYK